MKVPAFLVERLFRWARALIATRPRPDFSIIPKGLANPYLCRWFVIPRNPLANIYLHLVLESDDDRALHDHPWCSLSIILHGRYLEHLADGRVLERKAGDLIGRCASTPHRLEIIPGESCVTLFLTGPRTRSWGFHCPNGWKHHREYTADEGALSTTGRGCE